MARSRRSSAPSALVGLVLTACSNGGERDAPIEDAGADPDSRTVDAGSQADATPGNAPPSVDPHSAPRALIDRFSDTAATLMVRTPDNGLPAAGEPIDCDAPPFISLGLGPNGEPVRYYNFDVQPLEPAPMYVFRRPNGDAVDGQLPVVAALPGDDGYNDFWALHEVVLPGHYPPNSVTSVEQMEALGLTVEAAETLVNRPLVPEGSTATRRINDVPADPRPAWHDGRIAHFFSFETDVRPLRANDGSLLVNLSYIYVTFNTNPGEPGGGPPSGFVMEPGTMQTHNVVQTLPSDPMYSPLWMVLIYDNAEFGAVSDLSTAEAASIVPNAPSPNVNCPVVSVE